MPAPSCPRPGAMPRRSAPATAGAGCWRPARRPAGRSRRRPRRPGGAGPSRRSRRAPRRTPGRRGAAQQQVAQEVALVLVLDRRHRLLAGDQQRGDRGGALQRVHVVGGERPVAAAGTPAGPGRRRPPRPAACGPARRRPRNASALDPLHPEPAGRVEQVGSGQRRARVVVGQRRGPLPAVGRRDDHPDVEDPARPRRRSRPGRRPRARSGSGPVCSASTRASAALASSSRSPVINSCTPLPTSLAQPHIGKRNRPR